MLSNWRISSIFLSIFLVGCQAFASDDISATLSYDMTAFVTESAVIQQTASNEQAVAIETLQASSTLIAESANINMALAATVELNVEPTTAIRSVIVNPEDMGASLEGGMNDEEQTESDSTSSEVVGTQVNNLGTARNVNSSNGCSGGNVSNFYDDDEHIYVTARVRDLIQGIAFSIDWVYEQRLVYRSSWTSDYAARSECIWFYMTPDDAPFLPGTYTVTLYVNGEAQPAQQFSINTR